VWDPCNGLRYGRGQEMLRMHTCPLLTVGSLFNHRMVCANLQVGSPDPLKLTMDPCALPG
jgi:hypothetical protein